jgi:hypothetical protein
MKDIIELKLVKQLTEPAMIGHARLDKRRVRINVVGKSAGKIVERDHLVVACDEFVHNV